MIVTQKIASEELERYEVPAKNHTSLLDTNRPEMIKKGRGFLAWERRRAGGVSRGYF